MSSVEEGKKKNASAAYVILTVLVVGILLGVGATLLRERGKLRVKSDQEAIASAVGLTRSIDGLSFGEYVKLRFAAEARCPNAVSRRFSFGDARSKGSDDPYRITIAYHDDPPPDCDEDKMARVHFIADVDPRSGRVRFPTRLKQGRGPEPTSWLKEFLAGHQFLCSDMIFDLKARC